MLSTASSAIPDDISIFDQSSPESLRARALSPQLHDHLSSTSAEQTHGNDIEYDYTTYKPKSTPSNRSSISSFPGSVIHTVPFTDTEDAPRTPSRSQSYDRTLRAPGPSYLSAFRNPSSVRALQLESEWADSDASSTRHNSHARPKLSRVGSRSPGSVHSSPAKRLSRPSTPKVQSSKLKKEFPLVLLHCSLLPPSASAYGPLVADEILQAVLPEQYRKRWKILQDKVMKNNEVKQRGVLIPHPREDYDLLEERLLESLELQRPRIRRGHFLGGRKSGDSDSGFESSSQNGTDEASDTEDKDEQKPQSCCAECGTSVSRKIEEDRHWQVKVFAANGLMKSGAWAAAWEEMEKVDVEVGIWMPEDVKTEVEERLKALKAMEEAERPVDTPAPSKTRSKRTRSNTAKIRHDERMREIYGEKTETPTQEEIDGLADKVRTEVEAQEGQPSPMPSTTPQNLSAYSQPQQEDFFSFMKRNARIICHDQRNLAIVLLSILVLIFSFQNTKLDGTAHASSSSPSMNTTEQSQQSPILVFPSVSYVTQTVFATPSPSAEYEKINSPFTVHEPEEDSAKVLPDSTVEEEGQSSSEISDQGVHTVIESVTLSSMDDELSMAAETQAIIFDDGFATHNQSKVCVNMQEIALDQLQLGDIKMQTSAAYPVGCENVDQNE